VSWRRAEASKQKRGGSNGSQVFTDQVSIILLKTTTIFLKKNMRSSSKDKQTDMKTKNDMIYLSTNSSAIS